MQSSNGSVGSFEVRKSLEDDAPYAWKSRTEGWDRKSLTVMSGPAQKDKILARIAAESVAYFMTFLGLREFVKDRNPVLYEWMTEVARKFLLDQIDAEVARRSAASLDIIVDNYLNVHKP